MWNHNEFALFAGAAGRQKVRPLCPDSGPGLGRSRPHNLKQQIERLSAASAAASAHVHRINLVESEYLLAMLHAELAWVQGLERDIQSGTLAWKVERIFKDARVERKSAAKRENRP